MRAQEILSTGIIATAFMTLFLYFGQWARVAKGDMVRAIGSFVIHRFKGSFLVGLSLHLCLGVAFAAVYVNLFSMADLNSRWDYLGFGSMLGAIHGGFLCFFAMVGLSELHPIEEFKIFSIATALLHLTAHIIFGFFLGLGVYAMRQESFDSFLSYSALALILTIGAILIIRNRINKHTKDTTIHQPKSHQW